MDENWDKAAVYIGSLEHLKDKRVLLRVATHGYVVVQFNDIYLTREGRGTPPSIPKDSLGYGWHAFPESDFKLL